MKTHQLVLLLLLLGMILAIVGAGAKRKCDDGDDKKFKDKSSADDDDDDDEDTNDDDTTRVMSDPKRFAGWKRSAKLVKRCSRKGYKNRAMCWRDTCGGMKICYGTTVTCLCIPGAIGDRCQYVDPSFNTTTAAPPTPAPTTLETTTTSTTTTSTSTTSTTTSTTTTTSSTTTTVAQTTPVPPTTVIPTTAVEQKNLTCLLTICDSSKNLELLPGTCYDGRTGEKTVKCGIDSGSTAAPATTLVGATTTITSTSTSTTTTQPTSNLATWPDSTGTETTAAPVQDSRLGTVKYYAPDDVRQTRSFVSQNREELIASMPLRFGEQRGQTAAYLANLAQAVVDKVTGRITIVTQFSVRLAKATIPASKLANNPEFADDIARLPDNFSPSTKESYYNFVNRWGTHQITSVVVGARASHAAEKSTCDESRASALESEQSRIEKIVNSGSRDVSTLETVVGGPTRAELLANGLDWWADRVTMDNARHIEIGLTNISTFIDVPSKRAGVDAAIDQLMPTSDQIFIPDELECLSAGAIAGIVIGSIVGAILLGAGIYFCVQWCYREGVNQIRDDTGKSQVNPAGNDAPAVAGGV